MKNILLALLVIACGFNGYGQTYTQQWLRVLDSASSNTDELAGSFTTSADGCADVYYNSYQTPFITLSPSGKKIAIAGISGCNAFTSEINSADGSTVFQDIFSGYSISNAAGVAYDKNGSLFTMGILNYTASKNYLRKYDSTGSIQFTNIINNYAQDMENVMRIDTGGNIRLANISYTGSSNVTPLYGYNNAGILQWTSIINTYDWFYGYEGVMDMDYNGNTIFTGKYQTSSDPSTYQVVIRKVNPSGTQLWQVFYNAYPACYARNITIDHSGNIYMNITANGSGRLVKFNGVDGSILWDIASDLNRLKVNADNNLVGIGNNGNLFVCANYLTGATIWTKPITNGSTAATDINGNVYAVSTNMVRLFSSAGIPIDSVTISIPGYTARTFSLVVNSSGNAFYLLGERSSTGSNKIFVAKFSSCTSPTVSPITGSSIAYMGTPLTLSDSTTGGVWSSTNTAIANVSSSGVVTPVAEGVDTIKYTVTNSCGSTTVSRVITVAGAVPCYIPASGLVAWYPFTGNALDSSGNGNNGTNYGASLTADRFGNANSSYNFNGSNSNYITTSFTGISGNGARSVSVWVRLDSNNNGTVLYWGNPVDIYGTLWELGVCHYLSGGSCNSSYVDIRGAYRQAALNIADGNWHNIVSTQGTVSSINYSNLYIDGTLQTICSSFGDEVINTSLGNLTIGKLEIGGDTRLFKGKIDDIAIYNRVLTACEISTLFNASCAPITAGTITGSSSVTVGSTTTLTDATTGGTWSASNGNATVSATGAVTGVTAGVDTIRYTVSNACGSATASFVVTVNLAPSSVPCYVNTSGLMAWFPFTGNAIDSSSHGNNLTNVGGVTYGVDRFGNANSAAHFDGISQYLVNNSPNLPTGNSNRTISLWYSNEGGGDSNPSLFGMDAGLSGGCFEAFNMFILAARDGFYFWSGCNDKVWTQSSSLNTWYHLVLVNSNDTLYLYFNNALVSNTLNLMYPFNTDILEFMIGNGLGDGHGPTQYQLFNGKIDDIAIYSRALSPCEISNLYNASCAPLTAGTITGSSSVTVGSTTTLTDSTTGGTWSASNGNATVSASGAVTGVTAGVDTIKYTVSNACGSATASFVVTVNLAPSSVPCYVPAAGLVAWYPFTGNTLDSSGNSNNGTNYGATLTTDRFGNANSAYSFDGVSNYITASTNNFAVGNESRTMSVWFKVSEYPHPYLTYVFLNYGVSTDYNASGLALDSVTVGGPRLVLFGWNVADVRDTIVFDTTIWHHVVGTYDGEAGKLYFDGVLVGERLMSWNTILSLFTIGKNNISSGLPYMFKGIMDDIAMYNRALTPCEISNLFNASCAPLTAGTISGSSSVCAGSNLTLTDATAGGTWSSSNTAVATVGSTGVVNGISGGTATISYTVSNACGSATATRVVTVNAVVSVPVEHWTVMAPMPTPRGTCSGVVIDSIIYVIGGASSSGSSGVVEAYNVNTNTWATKSPMPTARGELGVAQVNGKIYAIGGYNGTMGTLTTVERYDPVTDAWTTMASMPTSRSELSVVAIGNNIYAVGGYPSGIATLEVYNALTNTWSTKSPLPSGRKEINSFVAVNGKLYLIGGKNDPAIFNDNYVYDTLSNAWSSAASLPYTQWAGAASVLNNKIYNFGGSANLGYEGGTRYNYSFDPISNTWQSHLQMLRSCASMYAAAVNNRIYLLGGTDSTNTSINWNYQYSITDSAITAPITGSPSLCQGSTTTLSDTASGGSWSSSNTSIATVSSAGVVTGVSAGTATISYTITNTCGAASATKVITVNPLPTAISGSSSVCVGANTTLTDASAGGTWSSSSSSATVGSSSGTVAGVSSGSTFITYTLPTGCKATKAVTVNPLPTAGTISGLSSVCVSATTTLTDATTGGTWSSSSANATVGSTGLVTGVTAGTATISYTVTTGCGSAYATQVITVNPLPAAGSISGASSVCTTATTILTDATAGGAWSSSSTSVATISSAGLVTGVASGTTTISYTVTTVCGTASATRIVSVNAAPSAGSLSGSATVCPAGSITLTDAVPGGTWSSSNTGVAAVSTAGSVTGVTAGTTIISYAVGNTCGTNYATQIVTVTPSASAGTVNGSSSVCVSATITLTDATTGGTWSASNANATVGSTGVVTGVTAGTTNITYTVTTGCGTATATKAVTVNPLSNAGSISGLTSVCVSATITLTDASSGGVWTSSNTGVATVGTSGSVSGASSGTTTISYAVTNSCGTAYATQNITVNPLPTAGAITGSSSVCAGSTTQLTDGTAGGTWSAFNANASVSGTGLVTGVTAGVDTVYYTITNTCGSATARYAITVNPAPNAGAITGSSSVCVANNISLADGISGGTWSSSAPGVATVGTSGSVTGVSAGTTTISYSVTNTCGTAYSTQLITVNPSANAGTITGLSTVCTGANITLTDAAAGGLWTSSNANATVVGGTVYGVTAGTNIISYTVNNPCGSATATYTVTINPAPTVGAISGSASVCVGSSITLSDASAGGSWISSNTSVATVGVSGSVTGVSAGTSTISYTIANGCGAATATQVVSVNPLPSAGTITGAASVCLGSSITLSDAVAGGSWSASNSNALVTSTGLVYGMASGSDIISYTVANGCGSATTTLVVSINVAPSGGGIFGASAVCIGSSTTLSVLGASGGTWSVGNANATVSAGVVTGVSAGIDSVYYTVTNGCGTGVARYAITVETSPYVAPLNGASYVCVGSVIVITDSIAGGYWSTSSSNVTPLGGGSFRGTSPGLVNIIYNVTNSCGTATANKIITVIALPSAGTITGASGVCIGSTATVTDAATGGIWSTTNSNAVISGYGLISGLTAGLDTIVYTNINVCGVATTSRTVTVNAVANAGTIAGLSSACVGNTVTLSDAAAGGIWSSSNTGVATVGTAGAVSAVAAGSATISYSVTNSCGTVTAILPFTVNPLPIAGSVTGASVVCTGSNAALTDAAAGGVWYASNSNAIVSSAGLVYGMSAGVDTITYQVTNSCGTATATRSVTVNPSPVAGTITGGSTVCAGSTLALTDAVSGGTWSSSGTTIATVGSAGLVTGILAGTATISYSVTNSCGTAIATQLVTVNPLPIAGSILGSSSVCAGSNIALSDASAGGVWSASNGNAVVSSGLVYGLTAGADTISYAVTNSCGTATATSVITINPLPTAGTIAGLSSVCPGANITLTDAIAGGTWSATNGNASVAAGLVTGVTAGLDTVVYTVTNGCGTATATRVITINNTTLAGTITGASTICNGGNTTLSDAVAGGVWTATNGNAFVNSYGVVLALSIGVDTINYNVTGACGSATATTVITINPLPSAGSISGSSSVCAGSTITLSDAVSGGVWTSSSSAVATVGSTGVVSGVASGATTISYAVTNSCGTAYASIGILVNPLPVAGTITGVDTVCMGHSITLSDAVSGGVWTTVTGHATISSMGLLTGLTYGLDTVVYTVSNACGSAMATLPVMVRQTDQCNGTAVINVDLITNVQVKPNPNKGLFTVTGTIGNSPDGVVTIEVTSMLGQSVYKKQVTTQDNKLNQDVQLSNTTANGMYLLSIRSGVDVKVFHIVVEQ